MKENISIIIKEVDRIVHEKIGFFSRWLIVTGVLLAWLYFTDLFSWDALIAQAKVVWNFVRIHQIIAHVAFSLFVLVCLGLNRRFRGLVGRFWGWIKYKKGYIGAVVGGLLVIIIFVFLLPFYLIPGNNSLRLEMGKLIAQCFGGIMLAITAIVTFRRMLASERQANAALDQAKAALEQVKTAQKQVAAIEDGQITTRYTEAIKQLGTDENLTIRLGGIYALERIARDSLKREPEGPAQDYRTVVEVLATYIREKGHIACEFQCKALEIKNLEEILKNEFDSKGLPPLRRDIQAALTVLGRLEHPKGDSGIRIDLQGAFLPKALLKNSSMPDVDLRGAILKGSNLEASKLERADLTGANLMQANLSKANLSKAVLCNVILRQANLNNANLERTLLIVSYLGYADLRNANLYGTSMLGARLERTSLYGAKNLTIRQLCETTTIYGARLDPEVLRLVKIHCPGKLVDPRKMVDRTNNKEEEKKHSLEIGLSKLLKPYSLDGILLVIRSWWHRVNKRFINPGN